VSSNYNIFIDFDGTVTSSDVGYEMFRKFTGGKTQPIVDRYRRGEVNSHQCLKTECEIWNRSDPPVQEVLDYLRRQEITPGFGEFIEILKRQNTGHYIVSEGFDFYIDAILDFNGFSNIERKTNSAEYSNGKIEPEFPYMASGCGECSNCKGYHIKTLNDPRSAAVFIGDGHSDFHGAEAADLVFARSFLKDSLRKLGRFHFNYDTFYDIIKIWESIYSRRVFAASERLYLCRAYEGSRGNFEKLWETGEVMKNVGFPGGLGWSREKYGKFWKAIDRKSFILLAVENSKGVFMGEAKLSFPDDENRCAHDVKLLPEFHGQGYGKEAWLALMDLSNRRWPDATLEVTPSVENTGAVKLYESLGFEFHGELERWIPPTDAANAVPVVFRRMLIAGKGSRGKI